MSRFKETPTTSRDTYRRFYGAEIPTETTSSQTLAENWQSLLQLISLTEMRKFLALNLIDFLANYEFLVEWLNEGLHAEKLRQLFGAPQSVLAIPVAINLTEVAEQAFQSTQKQAFSAASSLQYLREQTRKVLSLYLAEQIEKLTIEAKKLEQTEVELQKGGRQRTPQAQKEATLSLELVQTRKKQLEISIKQKTRQLESWWQKNFSPAMKKVDGVIFEAEKRAAQLPDLNPSLAIPVMN